MKKRILVWVVVLNLFINVCVAESFVVRKISIEGLQRISSETVYSYLPIRTGQRVDSEKTTSIISALYKTGFFDHISLSRSGNTLIVRVEERPTIGKLSISGNSSIPTDKLMPVMKSVGIAEGRVFNDVILEKIKQSLLDQYYSIGRYNARVNVSVTPMERNRVRVKIDISEGLIAKVRRINIIGNHVFTEKELDKQLELTTPGLLTFYTQTDRYSQEKLESSLEKLRNYYMDHGYLKFAVKSSQVSITPDRKSIYLTIAIDEGVPYTVKGIDIQGDTIVPRDVLMKKIHIKPGDTFSRQATVDGEKAISDTLGEQGYIFSVVNLEPKLDEKNHQVFLIYHVKPGRRAYVRHVYFTNNTKTNDEALRREVVQMEAAPVSTNKLEESKRRISLLPYIRNVEMGVEPVPNTNDNVDVDYKVTEDNSASATFTIGYSQLDHLILGAGLNQKNFMGTGKTLGFNVTRSKYQQFYGISYTNPYYTLDGISRTISVSAAKTDPRAANLSRSYNSDQYSASMIYGIPVGQEKNVTNTLQLGYGYEESMLRLSQVAVSQQVQNFVAQHGRHFQQVDLIAGYSRDSRDKAIFPTTGAIQTVSANLYAPIAQQSLKYYTLAYTGRWYHPIGGKFIAIARGDLGYGNAFNGAQNYPFFKNFYAGGSVDSVRGYDTLGPKDSLSDPTGGNFLADASLGVVFPNPVSDNLRTSLFVDGGNVYNTFNNRRFGGTGSGGPRYSVGVEADWLTPLGMIDLSLARGLNPQRGDSLEPFQFSLGANFG